MCPGSANWSEIFKKHWKSKLQYWAGANWPAPSHIKQLRRFKHERIKTPPIVLLSTHTVSVKMSGPGKRSNSRSRVKPSKHLNDEENDDVSLRRRIPNRRPRNDSSIRIFTLDLKIALGLSVVAFFFVLFLIYNLINHVPQAQIPRVVTPFPAPKLMDLPQVSNFDSQWFCFYYLLLVI